MLFAIPSQPLLAWDGCTISGQSSAPIVITDPSTACSTRINSHYSAANIQPAHTYPSPAIYFDCVTGSKEYGPLKIAGVGFCVKKTPCPQGYYPDSNTGECKLTNSKSKGMANCVGNPINAGLGNKFQKEMDFESVKSSLKLVRFYNSYGSENPSSPVGRLPRPWGPNWNDRYSRTILSVNGNTKIFLPDGRSFSFTYNSAAQKWKSDADVSSTLETIGGITKFRNADTGEVESYDSNYYLKSITSVGGYAENLFYSDGTSGANGGYILDANGNPTTTTLPSGFLIRVTDSYGRSLRFGYDASYHIVKAIDPGSNVYLYKYSPVNTVTNGNLISVIYPGGSARNYIYNEPSNTSGASQSNALTGITDEQGNRFATWQYDAQGRSTSSEHGLGVERVSISYSLDATGAVTSSLVTDASNTDRTYSFTTMFGVTKGTGTTQPCSSGCNSASAITYDTNGNVSSRTDFNGNVTNYTYDLTRNLETSRIEAYGTPQARTTTTQWHATYRLPTLITEPGKTTSFNYDVSGNLLSKTITDTTLNTSRTWSWTYNNLGQVLTADGPRTDISDVTTNTYYASTLAGQYTMGDLATVTNALGQVTSITQYDGSGHPLSITDPNDIVTTLTYTPRGWLKTKTINGTQTTTYDYDGVGQVTKITQPDGSYLSYTYDSAHRLTDITDGAGNKIHYTLDAMSNRIKEETFDPSGVLKKAQSKVYDALNRLQKDIGGTNPSTQIEQYSYDNNGNLKTTTDPLNRVTTNNYDALDRLVQVTDPNNGVAQNGYDALDQQSSATDPRSLITQYSNDALGNLKQLQSPDSGTTTNVYDAAGNITQNTEARGVVTNYTYDALNRLTAISYPASASENITFTYDDTSNGNKGTGRLTGYSTASTATTLFYDSYGNVTQQTDLLGSPIYTTGYAYNAGNRLTQITYPSGRIVTYTRNSLGQITQVQTQTDSNAAPVTIIGSAGYLPFGPLNALTFGNGVTTSLSYDLDYRVTRITATTSPVWDFGYSYDAGSHITGIADQVGGLSKTFGYDALYHVITDTNPAGTWNYTFDANSNRTGYTWLKPDNSSVTQAATVSATSNRLIQLNGNTVSTDAAGNLLSNSNSTYTYNNANRLASYSESGVLKATYGYNAEHQRTIKQAAKLMHYHYARDGKILATTEYNSDGSLYQRVEYLWLDDAPVAQVRTDYTNTTVSATRLTYIHVDHLNTPRAMSDSTQTVVWRWDSDAFGFVPPNNDPDGNSQTDNLALRFPGQYADGETGLSYNWHRYYDPSVGRYVTSDPIGLAGGLNTFGYVNGNPVSKTDPFGLAPGYEPSTTTWCRQNPAACAEIFGGTANGAANTGGAAATAAAASQCDNKDDKTQKKQKNCRALYDNIIKYTCASITNKRAQQKCWEAAAKTYDECISED